ncbi:MAG: homoserine O-succinyltransferase, partial [Candidatus Puniceispirillum sp.]
GLQILAEADACGVGMVRDPANGDLFVFNHLEYDAGTLGDEYQRDIKAGLNTAIPQNYYPDDDPSSPPVNHWRPFAFLLMANWINDLYQATPYDLSSLGKG